MSQSKEQVEAAARALSGEDEDGWTRLCDELPETADRYRDEAEAALTAASAVSAPQPVDLVAARNEGIEAAAKVAEGCDTLGQAYADAELTHEGMVARLKVGQIAAAIRALKEGQ